MIEGGIIVGYIDFIFGEGIVFFESVFIVFCICFFGGDSEGLIGYIIVLSIYL